MSLTTFNPPVGPTYPAARKTDARVDALNFGDGYSERSSGLNSLQDTLSLVWPDLTKAQADEIEAYFRARGGQEAFYWTAPHCDAPQKWVCKPWSRERQTGAFDKITATFTEVFDLDS